MRKRMIEISVRLNEEEYIHLKRQSEITGLKMEPLVRQLILGRDVKPHPPENMAALLRQVTPECIRAAAQSVQLDTIYFLKGKEA